MNIRSAGSAAVLLAWLSSSPAAQEIEGLPTEHLRLVSPGAWIDLDTGLLLPERNYRTSKADLQFGRDGAGFYLAPLFGGASAKTNDIAPPADLSTDRVRIQRSDDTALIFARTDHGMARVELFVADAYSTSSASLRWVVVPPKDPVFLPAPADLAATWLGPRLQVTWTGDQSRWLVEVATGDQLRKLTTEQKQVLLDELDAKGQHRIRVRGIAGKDVSMPAEVLQYGPRQLPHDGIVEFSEGWHDRSGGLRLSAGDAAVEDAEVVFYLYGVFVPGGGVQKLGTGEEAFAKLHELPGGAYPPVYGRIDDNDVLAVRIADGRYGKLWLEPAPSDLRAGMRVHFTFLPDGRRQLLPPPADCVCERTGKRSRLRWQASPGAVAYNVVVPGRPAALKVTNPEVVLEDLADNRVFACTVTAVAADGEQSAPVRATVHTYGEAVKMGRGKVTAQDGGFDFASAQPVANAAVSDLALVGGAGGAALLQFAGASGLAADARFAFGEFPKPDQLTFANAWSSDQRTGTSDHFYVRTADGGLASVRIVRRAWPTTEFEFVWMPKR